MWTQEMFGVEKPIIALLHLDALPGDPGYCGSMEQVIEHARDDLISLQDGGVDGILFANEFSLPYQPVADIAVISAMAYIIGNLKPLLRLPFGVNVVKNPIATIDLAAATGARFARSCFSGAYMGEYGLYTSNSGEAVRRRKALGIPDLKLLYKVNPRGRYLSGSAGHSGGEPFYSFWWICRRTVRVRSCGRQRAGRRPSGKGMAGSTAPRGASLLQYRLPPRKCSGQIAAL